MAGPDEDGTITWSRARAAARRRGGPLPPPARRLRAGHAGAGARRAGQPRRGRDRGLPAGGEPPGRRRGEARMMVLALLSGPASTPWWPVPRRLSLLVVGAPTPGLTERLRPSHGPGHTGRCPVVVVPAEKHHEGQLRRIVVGLKSPSTPTTSVVGGVLQAPGTTPSSPWCTPGGGRTPVPSSPAARPNWLPGEAALVEEQLAPLDAFLRSTAGGRGVAGADARWPRRREPRRRDGHVVDAPDASARHPREGVVVAPRGVRERHLEITRFDRDDAR